MQLDLLRARPCGYTSDDLLFKVYAHRNGIAAADRDAERATFFSKSCACLSASPLVKQYGWGLHHDQGGRVAAYGVGTAEYRQLARDPTLKQVSVFAAGAPDGRAGRAAF